jgi:DNA-binding transcriptional ArsR family regulator
LSPEHLDRLFAALANRQRREMVDLLGLQPYSISRLAALHGVSLPAMNKHVKVLESAGLVTRRKLGRTTFLTLDRSAIRTLQTWLGKYHAYWGTDLESLENYERFLASDPPTTKEER